MEEPVRFDLEQQTAVPVEPCGVRHRAAVVVLRRRRAPDSEAQKAVFAANECRAFLEQPPVERASDAPFGTAAKGGLRFLVRPDLVAVPASDRVVSRVEIVAHRMSVGHPDVVGQDGVERAAQSVRPPLVGNSNADCLAAGVHAGIGATGAKSGGGLRADPAECRFEHALHGAPVRLPLPPAEARAVVVQHELHRASRHRGKKYPTALVCQAIGALLQRVVTRVHYD